MNADWRHQLQDAEVPPVPETFDQGVHARVNHFLLALHLAEFAVRGLPAAAWELFRATADVAHTSPPRRRSRPPQGGNDIA